MKKVLLLLAIGGMLITFSCQKQINKPADLPQSNQTNKFSPEHYQEISTRAATATKAEIETLKKLSARLSEESKTRTEMSKRPPRGTAINVPGDYASIQEAVDNAPDGATIHVTGSYIENVEIVSRNNITINGGGTATLTRAPEGSVAFAVAFSSGIVIKGFTVIDGAISTLGSQQIEFSNNDVSGLGDGIQLIESHNCVVKNNTVHDNYSDGLGEAYGDGEGIYLYHADQNTISNNHTNHNFYHGIMMLGSSDNSVQSNIVANDGEGGIGIFAEITDLDQSTVQASNSNTLQMNEISGTASAGINIYCEASGNVLKNNQSHNNSYGLAIGGLPSSYPSGNKISSCNFSNNDYEGVSVFQYATNNTITSSTASDNGYYGFRLEAGSANNTIRNCSATGNGDCDYWDQGTNNTSVHNTFGHICN